MSTERSRSVGLMLGLIVILQKSLLRSTNLCYSGPFSAGSTLYRVLREDPRRAVERSLKYKIPEKFSGTLCMTIH